MCFAYRENERERNEAERLLERLRLSMGERPRPRPPPPPPPSGDRLGGERLGERRRISGERVRRRGGGEFISVRRSSFRRSFSRMIRSNISNGSSMMPVPICCATP